MEACRANLLFLPGLAARHQCVFPAGPGFGDCLKTSKWGGLETACKARTDMGHAHFELRDRTRSVRTALGAHIPNFLAFGTVPFPYGVWRALAPTVKARCPGEK
jgi:hypothetical protein